MWLFFFLLTISKIDSSNIHVRNNRHDITAEISTDNFLIKRTQFYPTRILNKLMPTEWA